MGNKKSISRNYIYNMLYHVFLIVVPVAVTPYVARTLGTEASGKYTFANSINYYFILVGMLGFNLYGQRLIASHQGNKKQQSVDFFEVLIARSIPTVISLLLYIAIICFNAFDPKYKQLLSVLIINIIANLFDVVFLFQGNEEFGRILWRNFVIKSIGFISVFIFVKSPDDVIIYAIIQCLIILFSALSLWVYLPGSIESIPVSSIHPLKHLKPAFILFLPTIATTVYTYLDKTLIGLITRIDSENGNYSYAESIVKMGLMIITSFGTVIIPRNSAKFEAGDIRGVIKSIYTSCKFVFFIGVPMMLGLFAIADNMVPWYLGLQYLKAAQIMKILSPIILIIGLSNVFGLQFLIPSKRDKEYTIAIVSGAIINFLLNLVLIKYWMSYGAAIATVIAEFSVTTIMAIFISREIDLIQMIVNARKYLLSGALMFLVCLLLSSVLSPSILNSSVIVFCGAAVYTSLLWIMKDELLILIIHKLSNMRKRLIKTVFYHDRL